MIPTALGDDYQIGEILGVGTVGTIFRATDRRTGQQVAIKKLHPTISSDPLIRARFRREMMILNRLDHPNIIHYYGGGEDSDGLLYYVMELVEGGTVKDLLENYGRLMWPAVVEIGRQLCSALQHAHNQGVIHRDLKPGNLFLTTDGEVKLGDFGIARDLEHADLTDSGTTVGTHAYMAPEQIRGEVTVSGKADLYSLGCCLFELLTGSPPYQGENFAQLFDQHLHREPPRVRDLVAECPPQLDQIIARMLAKQPEDRPFNARQVQGLLLELANPLTRDGSAAVAGSEESSDDVGSANVSARGREMLRRQIRAGHPREHQGDISWQRLTVLFGALILMILLAVLAGAGR